MADSELSIVRFSFLSIWNVILTSRPFFPIQSLLIKLILALIEAEQIPDLEHKKKVEYIYNHTNAKIDVPVSIVELAVFKNLDRALSKDISIGDNEFSLIELYRGLDEVTLELTKISIDIAKKYSMDLEINNLFGNRKGHTTTIGEE